MMKAVASTCFLLFLALCPPGYGEIIKRAPPKPVELSWNDLPCSERDRADIYEIVSTVAEKGKVNLLINHQSDLREKGARIEHVHPLKFFSVILSNPQLKHCMNVICDDYFKRTNFVGDLISALKREAERGKTLIYLNEFGSAIGVPPESLRGYFDSKDWENMIYYLIRR